MLCELGKDDALCDYQFMWSSHGAVKICTEMEENTQPLNTALFWSPGAWGESQQKNNRTRHANRERDCPLSCQTCPITHAVDRQWRSCQFEMMDSNFCRCQGIPQAHCTNGNKWKCNKRFASMSSCYIITGTKWYCLAFCWRMRYAFPNSVTRWSTHGQLSLHLKEPLWLGNMRLWQQADRCSDLMRH